MDYLFPAGEFRYEQPIRKSRFVGILRPTGTRNEVEAVRGEIQEEFPDATHHCWAYVLGDPEQTTQIRASDDGEPSGTAGRPILSVLQQNRVGDALLVVVRYFGGVKLGAGGLVRAYSSTASGTLDVARLEPATPMTSLRLTLDYADERAVRAVLVSLGAEVRSVAYGSLVLVELRVPTTGEGELRSAVTEMTSGRARLDEL